MARGPDGEIMISDDWVFLFNIITYGGIVGVLTYWHWDKIRR